MASPSLTKCSRIKFARPSSAGTSWMCVPCITYGVRNVSIRNDMHIVQVALFVWTLSHCFCSGEFISLGPFDQPLSVLVRPCPPHPCCTHHAFTRTRRSPSLSPPRLLRFCPPFWTASAPILSRIRSASCLKAAAALQLQPLPPPLQTRTARLL